MEYRGRYLEGNLAGALSMPNAAGPVYTIGIFGGKPIPNIHFERDEAGFVISPKVLDTPSIMNPILTCLVL